MRVFFPTAKTRTNHLKTTFTTTVHGLDLRRGRAPSLAISIEIATPLWLRKAHKADLGV